MNQEWNTMCPNVVQAHEQVVQEVAAGESNHVAFRRGVAENRIHCQFRCWIKDEIQCQRSRDQRMQPSGLVFNRSRRWRAANDRDVMLANRARLNVTKISQSACPNPIWSSSTSLRMIEGTIWAKRRTTPIEQTQRTHKRIAQSLCYCLLPSKARRAAPRAALLQANSAPSVVQLEKRLLCQCHSRASSSCAGFVSASRILLAMRD